MGTFVGLHGRALLLTVGLAAVPVFIEHSARNRSPIEKLKLKL